MNEKEKRSKAESLNSRGLPWDEAKRLVDLTEAKALGTIKSHELEQLTDLQIKLELLLPRT